MSFQTRSSMRAVATLACAFTLAPGMAQDAPRRAQPAAQLTPIKTTRPAPVQVPSQPTRGQQRPPQVSQQAQTLASPSVLEPLKGKAIERPGTQRVGAQQGIAASRREADSVLAAIKTSHQSAIRMADQPGIHRLNDKGRGVFEPGGRYVIGGKGFGTRKGTVTLRSAALGRPIDLQPIVWQDDHIMVEVSASLSGLPDVENVELTVAIPDKASMTSNRFGFRALRETVTLRDIPHEAIRTSGHQASFRKPNSGTGVVIERLITDDRNGKRCFSPGQDRILDSRITLQPGFVIESAMLTSMRMSNAKDGKTNNTANGNFHDRWEGLDLVVDWGVQRTYFEKTSLVPVVLTGGLILLPARGDEVHGLKPGQGYCLSQYEVQLYVSGPRGMSPL